jgi:hypothetical protein
MIVFNILSRRKFAIPLYGIASFLGKLCTLSILGIGSFTVVHTSTGGGFACGSPSHCYLELYPPHASFVYHSAHHAENMHQKVLFYKK